MKVKQTPSRAPISASLTANDPTIAGNPLASAANESIDMLVT